jgi:hypothetical protein
MEWVEENPSQMKCLTSKLIPAPPKEVCGIGFRVDVGRICEIGLLRHV